jgi:hypothetical protein
VSCDNQARANLASVRFPAHLARLPRVPATVSCPIT